MLKIDLVGDRQQTNAWIDQCLQESHSQVLACQLWFQALLGGRPRLKTGGDHHCCGGGGCSNSCWSKCLLKCLQNSLCSLLPRPNTAGELTCLKADILPDWYFQPQPLSTYWSDQFWAPSPVRRLANATSVTMSSTVNGDKPSFWSLAIWVWIPSRPLSSYMSSWASCFSLFTIIIPSLHDKYLLVGLWGRWNE